MDFIIDGISFVLSFVMRGIYELFANYGLSIIVFTLFTKVILLPVSIMIQKNSVTMTKMQPQLDALKIKYIDDKNKLADETLALYKKNHYHVSLSVLPLVFQLILIFGMLGIVYNPMTYVLGIDGSQTSLLNEWLENVVNIKDAGNSAQLDIIHSIQSGKYVLPEGITSETLSAIKSFDLEFLGIDLGAKPSFAAPLLLLIPFLSGVSAWLMCWVQNKINILQVTAGKLSKYGMTVFMIAFSAFFAFIVPTGIGLYWIFGNLFAVPNMFLMNIIIPPKKHVDIEYLKKIREQKLAKEQKFKKYHKKEKEDNKRFAAEKNKVLVFYSESSGFYKYYSKIIDYVCEHSDIVIHYVTSDPEDKIFSDPREQIKAYYSARDRYLISLFLQLDCKMCVMTMPDLQKYHIKRSKVNKNIEYVYICHGMGSNALTLRKGALDWYDTMFCVGIDAENEVRELEELYQRPQKTLIEAGYPLLDDMIESIGKMERKENDPKKILIAPSWQPDNIIESCITELLDSLAGTKYEVILRPHPQMVRNTPEKFEILHEKYDGTNVEIQTDFSLNSPVLEADVVVTDWSEISFEYAFTTLRPVLFIDTPMKIMNADYDKIKTAPINITLRNVIGRSLSLEECPKAAEVIDELIENRESWREAIEKARDEHIFNVGKSTAVHGRYIIKRLGK